MARNIVAMTARAMTKGARATAAGATRTTAAKAATVATMTPNGDKDNKDGNSKNNDKATRTLTMTTEGDERRQSQRDNRGGGHPCPGDTASAPTAASSRHAFVGSVVSPRDVCIGRLVDLALYKTKVLGSKPPPGGLSTNPRLMFVTFASVSVHSCHT